MTQTGNTALDDILLTADVKLNGDRPFDIKVHDERLIHRVLKDREIGIGEAYMDGWWSSGQLDETVARLQSVNIREHLPVTPTLVRNVATGLIANRQKLRRAYENAGAHYNIGNDLYERMLDKRMIYSCGFWQKAKTLDAAQEAKLDRVCKKLKLKEGMTLLDIGCGWGGFAEFAAEKYGAVVTGISPAVEQVKAAQFRTRSLPVTIQLRDYRELTGKFDRIVSIGMLEHVGPKNYRRFFKKCRELLNDDGLMLHHFIGSNRSLKVSDPWVSKYIFPGGAIPALAQVSKAVERKLIVEDVENFGPDYDKTLLAWYANFIEHYPEIKDKYDERFYRMWEYYLLSCAGTFRARKLQLYQVVMRKVERSPAYRGYR